MSESSSSSPSLTHITLPPLIPWLHQSRSCYMIKTWTNKLKLDPSSGLGWIYPLFSLFFLSYFLLLFVFKPFTVSWMCLCSCDLTEIWGWWVHGCKRRPLQFLSRREKNKESHKGPYRISMILGFWILSRCFKTKTSAWMKLLPLTILRVEAGHDHVNQRSERGLKWLLLCNTLSVFICFWLSSERLGAGCKRASWCFLPT